MILNQEDIERLEYLIDGWLDENPPKDETTLLNEAELAWLAQRAIFTIQHLGGVIQRLTQYSFENEKLKKKIKILENTIEEYAAGRIIN